MQVHWSYFDCNKEDEEQLQREWQDRHPAGCRILNEILHAPVVHGCSPLNVRPEGTHSHNMPIIRRPMTMLLDQIKLTASSTA